VAEIVVLLDQPARTMFRRKVHPKRVIADAKHAMTTNILTLAVLRMLSVATRVTGGTSDVLFAWSRLAHFEQHVTSPQRLTGRPPVAHV
jgi:hypothetical protein